MTREEVEALKATYPKYTVYMSYLRDTVSAKTGDYYAERGKSYDECTAALEKSEGFKERQDEDLYNLVRILESRKTVDKADILERLNSISFDIDSLIEDIDD